MEWYFENGMQCVST